MVRSFRPSTPFSDLHRAKNYPTATAVFFHSARLRKAGMKKLSAVHSAHVQLSRLESSLAHSGHFRAMRSTKLPRFVFNLGFFRILIDRHVERKRNHEKTPDTYKNETTNHIIFEKYALSTTNRQNGGWLQKKMSIWGTYALPS